MIVYARKWNEPETEQKFEANQKYAADEYAHRFIAMEMLSVVFVQTSPDRVFWTLWRVECEMARPSALYATTMVTAEDATKELQEDAEYSAEEP